MPLPHTHPMMQGTSGFSSAVPWSLNSQNTAVAISFPEHYFICQFEQSNIGRRWPVTRGLGHVCSPKQREGDGVGKEQGSSASYRAESDTIISDHCLRSTNTDHIDRNEEKHLIRKKGKYKVVKCFLGTLNKPVHHHFLKAFRNVNNMVFMNSSQHDHKWTS